MTPELQAACEAIFQEHRTHAFAWNKDAFHGRISTGMLDLAKEVLLEKNIIYYQHPGKKLVTLLNPEAAKAGSFTEALAFVRGKPLVLPPKEKPPLPPVVNINHHRKEVTTPVVKIKEPEIESKPSFDSPADEWYLRPVFVYFIWPLLGAAVFWFIAYLLSAGYDELFFKKEK